MAAEGEQAVGQARQAVATSGFRSTGSAMNATNEVQRKSDVQIDQAERQLKLTAAQNYVSASENYLSAERKVQEYQDNIETNLLNLELYLQREEREWGFFQENVSDLSDYASDLRGAIENEKGWGLTASIFTLGIYQGNSYQSEFAALESQYNYLLQLARRTSL